MKKLFIIAILSCNFLNAQSNAVSANETKPGDIRASELTTEPFYIIASPTESNAHLFFGEPVSTAGQASAKLTFAGLGIQHAGLVWIPGTTLDNGKLNLSFGGSNNGMENPTKVTYQSNGNVGIGTQNPISKLSVYGSITINSGLIGSSPRPAISASTLQDGEIRAHSGGSALADDGFTRISAGGGTNGNAKSYIDLSGYSTVPDMDKNIVMGTSGNERLRIDGNGNVGVGTANPAHKLDVIGTIRAREVKVNLDGADFVFEDGYKLMPLNELEKFVKQNKHLPEIAPAKEMQENGSNLGSLSVQLLQKIEELTLHVIEQNKKMDLQNKETKLLQEKVKELEKLN